jgi:hypothetical protein
LLFLFIAAFSLRGCITAGKQQYKWDSYIYFSEHNVYSTTYRDEKRLVFFDGAENCVIEDYEKEDGVEFKIKAETTAPQALDCCDYSQLFGFML